MLKFWVSIVFTSIGIVCMIAYQTIGIYINTLGFLEEPFFLIPIGYLFLFFGFLLFLQVVFSKHKTIRRKY